MLSFTHAGNRLSSVQSWDGANLPQIGTFTYDALGNQLADSRKGLQFSYNFANLPSKVEGSAGSGNAGLTLNYGYLSDGTKTSAITETAAGSGAEGLKYRGSFVYELKDGEERVSSVGWSEGRTEYVYAPALVEDGDEVLEGPEELLEIDDLWYIADHLGNTRAVVNMSAGGTVVEQNDYLPFGTRLANPAFEQYSNRYRLGGKEEQRFGGLDLAMSDFGARYYDPFTARWTTSDPMAGKYHSLSPYNYCAGNPVNCIDVKGDSLRFLSEVAIQALRNGIAAGTNVSLCIENGVLLPSSLPENSSDFFINDLMELASSSTMITVDISETYLYSDFGVTSIGIFKTAPYDYDDTEDALKYGFERYGNTIQGNLGQTLLPVLSKKVSMDNNVNVILNSKGSLNHITVGMAHEFGHVILFLNGEPSGHGEPGVDSFVYSRASEMSKRLGYDR